MKKYEVVVDDESAGLLTELLKTLPYVKDVKQKSPIDPYTLASESSLSEDWLAEDDDELQSLYKK